MKIIKNKYSLRILVDNKEVAYLVFHNNFKRYWAPNVYLVMLEVIDKKHRRLGLGTILIEELKKAFPKNIITCEIMLEGETNYEALQAFYDKLEFEEVLDMGYSRVLAFIPEGKSLEELGPVPKEILYKEIVENEDTGYELHPAWLDDIKDIYQLDFDSTEDFDYFYDSIKDSEVFKALSYY